MPRSGWLATIALLDRYRWIVTVSLLLLAWWVWLTPYHYERAFESNQLIRIDRITGESFALTTAGWYHIPEHR
jgi:hypothetical protein